MNGVLSAQQAKSTSAPQEREASLQTRDGSHEAGTIEQIGDLERSALTFTDYDLSIHLSPESASLSGAARVTVRNDGAEALSHIALQISSSLHWDSASQTQNGRSDALVVNRHLLETDADHTGQASEAVLLLTTPLLPHASTQLVLLYSGSIRQSTARMERMGASVANATASDWDLIGASETALRGFGYVLWYPTASPQVFLGEGATLPHAAGLQLLRQAAASTRLRVSVEYTGEAPPGVFFCGRYEHLKPASDTLNAADEDRSGIATAEFGQQKLGFRPLSLFISKRPASAAGRSLAIVSDDPTETERLSAISKPILAMLDEWTGGDSAQKLTVIDHKGFPFMEGDLLVAPVSDTEDSSIRTVLLPALTHTRFRSSYSWLEEGMAQFIALLWIERSQGRSTAISALVEGSHELQLAESMARPDQPSSDDLIHASDVVFYRAKAAAILWMLRDLVGDQAFKQVLARYSRDPKLDRDAEGFERLLEEVSGQSLRWFFNDWVYRDPGLPDLSIGSVAPRELSSGTARSAGWLVAVEVRNDGGAVADVPVTIRSGTLTATERLRVNAHSVAATRIVFQGVPEQVQVNDGSVPELISCIHLRQIADH